MKELLSFVTEGKLSTPSTKRIPVNEFQEAIGLADGELSPVAPLQIVFNAPSLKLASMAP
jgi:hypothetical protein